MSEDKFRVDQESLRRATKVFADQMYLITSDQGGRLTFCSDPKSFDAHVYEEDDDPALFAEAVVNLSWGQIKGLYRTLERAIEDRELEEASQDE